MEKDRFPRSRFSEDRLGLVPGDWRGVEPAIQGHASFDGNRWDGMDGIGWNWMGWNGWNWMELDGMD